MARKGRKGRSKRRRFKASSLFVSESMLTEEQSVASKSQFDTGVVKRKVNYESNSGKFQKEKFIRSVTPARRFFHHVTEELEPEERPFLRRLFNPASWLESMRNLIFSRRNNDD